MLGSGGHKNEFAVTVFAPGTCPFAPFAGYATAAELNCDEDGHFTGSATMQGRDWSWLSLPDCSGCAATVTW